MRRSCKPAAVTICLAALTLISAGCGGSSGTISSIAVAPTSVSVGSGATQQFTATATNTDNSTHDITSSAVWSSANPNSATVTSSGVATAFSPGGSAIIATSGNVTGNSGMTVNLTSLFINNGTTSAIQGQQVQFTAGGNFTDGSFQDVTTAVTWSTSNNFATVTTTGLVTAVSPGTVNIIATTGKFSNSVSLTVQ